METERSFKAIRFEGIREGNLRPIPLKRGGWSTTTVKHHWAPCDSCGVGTWVLSTGLPRKCRMTPRCSGQHRKAQT